MSRLVRRDQLEIGIEREYALYAATGGTLAYLLAGDRLLASFHAHVASDAARQRHWQSMQAEGWRIAPEYSHCLIEIASPPYPRSGWPDLLAGFTCLEDWITHAAQLLAAQSRFDEITCTAEYSVRTDRFITWDGTFVATFADLLLVPTDHNWLLGSRDRVPACFTGSAPELSYAGFTSTNATLHPPMPDRDLGEFAEPLADYYWRILHAARQIETASPQRHALLRDGRIPVAPDPELSIRDALIRWGDPSTAALLDALPLGARMAYGLRRINRLAKRSPVRSRRARKLALGRRKEAAQFQALFGQLPSSSFTAPGFHAYSCRPRVLENVMLFELRCFHSGLPLANLAPLLDVTASIR